MGSLLLGPKIDGLLLAPVDAYTLLTGHLVNRSTLGMPRKSRFKSKHPYILKTAFHTKTCPCNVYLLEPHFHIAKLWYAGVYLFF